jgi:hypothetical protein
MNTHADCLLQLNHLSGAAVHDLSSSFDNLPHTKHADGQYRLRRYSVVRINDGKVQALPGRSFVQSEQVNHFQGDVIRQFEDIEQSIIASKGMYEMCALFLEANNLSEQQDIEIHQIRIAAQAADTPVAPEGVHQDGFSHIAVVGIRRHNIDGGDFMVFKDKHQAPIMTLALDSGEVALLDDSKLWHYARPIRAHRPSEPGFMDVFVLTAKDEA